MLSQNKSCTGCGETRPISEFYWTRRRNGDLARHSKCKICRRSQFSSWAKTARGRAVKREGILRREYGISEEDFERMSLAQGGVCAICREPEKKLYWQGTPLRLCVDHDHSTGVPRALLCSGCNVGLGSFRDNPELLMKAAEYLKGQAAKTEALVTAQSRGQ